MGCGLWGWGGGCNLGCGGGVSTGRACLFVSGSMLKINPEERLSITELVNQLQEIAAARNTNPKSPITEVTEPPAPRPPDASPSSALYLQLCFKAANLPSNENGGALFSNSAFEDKYNSHSG